MPPRIIMKKIKDMYAINRLRFDGPVREDFEVAEEIASFSMSRAIASFATARFFDKTMGNP